MIRTKKAQKVFVLRKETLRSLSSGAKLQQEPSTAVTHSCGCATADGFSCDTEGGFCTVP